MGLFNKKEQAKINAKLVSLFNSPLSEEALSSGFVKSLTPLKLSEDEIRRISFAEFGRCFDGAKIKRGVPTYKCYLHGHDCDCEISLYEEGMLLKYRKDVYFRKFSKASICANRNYETVREDYRFRNPVEVLRDILQNNYYYFYKTTITSTRVEYEADTRHYKSDGTLDKRYSRQNQSTGARKTYCTGTFTENFMILGELGNFCCKVDDGFLEYETNDLNEFVKFVVKIYKTINKNLSDETITVKYRGIPLLTAEDRKVIEACLNKDYAAECVVDVDAIRARYDMSDWEDLGQGNYRKVFIGKNGVEQTHTRKLSKIINGVYHPFTAEEIEEKIERDIQEAQNAHLDLMKDAADEVLDNIIESRKADCDKIISKHDEFPFSSPMSFAEFKESMGIDLDKYKSEDKKGAAFDLMHKCTTTVKVSKPTGLLDWIHRLLK